MNSSSPHSPLVKNQSARDEAKNLWNLVPCGDVVDAPHGSLQYFLQIETLRYRVQNWQHSYFKFEDFKGKKILEIGVGQGTDQAQFAKAGAVCHGIDITQNHLELTALNFKRRGFKIDLRTADATAIPFPDGDFDAVYSFGVIHHIPDVDMVLREAHRVIQPGGMIMLAVYNRWSVYWIIKMVFMLGLLRLWLVTKGLGGLKATIETGADGVKIKPYVCLDSKKIFARKIQRAGFVISDIPIHQLHADHFMPKRLVSSLGWLVKPLIPLLESRMGWYITVKASKN
ncbi:MAG: class I SAM-dependent methyltransferase [Alphaproteobacteria bacterium]|nr:class I SAM-dependent methyltransferase [Alphaproteobacteria bacterium]